MPPSSGKNRQRPRSTGIFDRYGEPVSLLKIIGLCFSAAFVLGILIVAFGGELIDALKVSLLLFLGPIVVLFMMRYVLRSFDVTHAFFSRRLRPLRRRMRHFFRGRFH